MQFEWRMDEYLSSLVEVCVRRRNENMERWKALGGTVGLSEWEFLEPFESRVASKEYAGSALGLEERQRHEKTAGNPSEKAVIYPAGSEQVSAAA